MTKVVRSDNELLNRDDKKDSVKHKSEVQDGKHLLDEDTKMVEVEDIKC